MKYITERTPKEEVKKLKQEIRELKKYTERLKFAIKLNEGGERKLK